MARPSHPGGARLVAAAALVALLGGIAAITLGSSGSKHGRARASVVAEAPSTVASPPAHPAIARLTLKGIGAYDPEGDGTENDADARLATDGNATTAWKSERYHGAFTKSGVGLVLDAGRPVRATRLTVATESPGYTAEVRVGVTPKGPFTAVSEGKVIAAKTTFVLRPRRARYLMLWITAIPTPGAAAVNEITATTSG
jgi:hypothetical protein